MAEKPTLSSEEITARAKLGRWLVIGGLVVVLMLGLVAVIVALSVTDVEKKFGYVKDIIAIILPVVAAWVGTVLAFYFSKENFVAAAEKTTDLVMHLTDRKLQEVPVSSVMIPIEKAEKLQSDKPDADIKLKSEIMDGFFAKTNVNRVPIVTGAMVVKYILHRSMFDKFIASKALDKTPPKLEDLTLDEMLKDAAYKAIALGFRTVKQDSNLGAVKAIMDANPECSDVFVTDDGSRTSAARGWITNVIVAEKAKL